MRSPDQDLFKPLPESFDLAVLHRFHSYLPGWEIPPSSSDLLTAGYGFITDYLAEAMHFLAKQTNRFAYVKGKARLGAAVRGRDETAVIKTVAGFLKLLHPRGEPSDSEFNEYLEYALEGRRRVKEQLNKRKPDDEFAAVQFSYFAGDGVERAVFCPESKALSQTAAGVGRLTAEPADKPGVKPAPGPVDQPMVAPSAEVLLKDRHFTIHYGDAGYGYEKLFGPYLAGAKTVVIEDPYIRLPHQIANFTRFCELVVKTGAAEKISLVTGADDQNQEVEISEKLDALVDDLKPHGIVLEFKFDARLHDRKIKLDNGWIIKIGRGFDIYQRIERPRSGLGMNDFDLRPCLETSVDIFREGQI